MLFTHHDRFRQFTPWAQLDNWMDELHQIVSNRTATDFASTVSLPINIRSDEHAAVVTAEIPGIDPQLVGITVHGDALTISVQSPDTNPEEQTTKQAISRTVHLPFAIDANKTEAKSVHGLLIVTLQRPESEQPKKISVKVV